MKNFLVLGLSLLVAGAMSAESTTVDQLMMLTVGVGDVDKSKAFYTLLGCKAVQDYSKDGQRWVTLQLPGGGTTITLSTVMENLKPGTITLYFKTADVEAVWSAVKDKELKVTQEPTKQAWPGSPWAAWFGLVDPDGNGVLVVQLKDQAN
jgi:catechol 2,3-dioxygenase-like lactoylglutathione lyase family enzyme